MFEHKFNQPLGGNEMPRFAGPATMMRLPSQPSAEASCAASTLSR